MRYPLHGIAAYLICHSLLFDASALAQQKNEPPATQGISGGTVVSYHPPCTEKNPKPDCAPAPQLLSSPQPAYSEEARKAKIEGLVILGLTVDEKGNPTRIYVINSLGYGLDEKAIEAVKGWKFDPAYGKDGKPVAKRIAVEVSFHL